MKLLKSDFWTIHHLLILITKALHYLLLVESMRTRGKRTKTKNRERDNTERTWENEQRQKRHAGCVGGKRMDTWSWQRNEIQWKNRLLYEGMYLCFLLPHFSYCDKVRLLSKFERCQSSDYQNSLMCTFSQIVMSPFCQFNGNFNWLLKYSITQ